MKRYHLDDDDPFESKWPQMLGRFERIIDDTYDVGFNDVVPFLSHDCPYIDRCSKTNYDEPDYKKWNLNAMAKACLDDLDGGYDGSEGDIERALKWSAFFAGLAKRFKNHADSMKRKIDNGS